jgi:hypothetical protein
VACELHGIGRLLHGIGRLLPGLTRPNPSRRCPMESCNPVSAESRSSRHSPAETWPNSRPFTATSATGSCCSDQPLTRSAALARDQHGRDPRPHGDVVLRPSRALEIAATIYDPPRTQALSDRSSTFPPPSTTYPSSANHAQARLQNNNKPATRPPDPILAVGRLSSAPTTTVEWPGPASGGRAKSRRYVLSALAILVHLVRRIMTGPRVSV